MRIKVKLLEVEDTDRLYAFEVENQSYFRSIGLGRSNDYYDYKLFSDIIKNLVAEQKNHIHYMYLVWNEAGDVIGRVNLTDVVPEPFCKAELGYRIGKAYQRKGYGTEAVKLVIEEAFATHGLHRLEAGTSPANIGSQIILIKNKFQFVGKYHQYVRQGGQWEDSILFERVTDSCSEVQVAHQGER